MASLNDIRSTFLDFFERNSHQIVESSSLVPNNDPTLMFVNSGMVQFKNVFTGIERRDYNRATTSQKCVRAGGKHNDLDNVGYTARHLTFFEMLGNFSFGDYFKDEAIPYAWELLTKDFGINKDKLYVTVYHTDDQAAELWKKVAGFSDDKIIRIATDDNFWMMGATGPCGPSSEIFYDHGPDVWGGPPGSPEEDGDRFIEIWNLVFMQHERFEDGSQKDLPKTNIDTGMGMERFGALLSGSHDVFDTDTMRALMEASAQATGVDPDGDGNAHHRVIADHLRSTAFLVAEGVMPSNEGRGYVLRRIMRRAMRHAHLLGAKDPVMHRLVPALVAQMGQAFPELSQGQSMIEETFELEETRFKTTLDRGLSLLEAEAKELGEGGTLPGETAFKLYDTYGFPLDLTQDAMREKGAEVDVAGFDAAMTEQKNKARAAWAGTDQSANDAVWFQVADKVGETEFLGYATEHAEAQVLAIVADGQVIESLMEGQSGFAVLNQTPFYAESGGQVGDKGSFKSEKSSGRIDATQRLAGLIVKSVVVEKGSISTSDFVELTVDHTRRSDIRKNHSATHLLHEALRRNLGDHVAQRGSMVSSDRLRFDFAHNKSLTPQEISSVQAEVNAYIRQNTSVETRIMTPEDAKSLGARALFGEKYGDEVRVVSMGTASNSGLGATGDTYSLELCGGTHVNRTGDIGYFKLVSESASASGVRRVEAFTGEEALRASETETSQLRDIAGVLKAPSEVAAERVESLLNERKELQNEIADLRKALALSGGSQSDASGSVEIEGVPFLAQTLTGVSGKDLRGLIDEHKSRLVSGAVLLIADTGVKAAIAAGVTDDLKSRISAVDLVRSAAEVMGGKGGGGRPDMAQGGGNDFSKAEEAIEAAKEILKGTS